MHKGISSDNESYVASKLLKSNHPIQKSLSCKKNENVNEDKS